MSGNIGTWAAEAEREEQEQAAAAAAAAASMAADSRSFPSLREAVKEKPKKKKMTLSLSQFHSGGGSASHFGGATDRLPTAPRERSAEEMQSGRLGGGFSNYGGGRRSYGGGGGGGFDDERRGPMSGRVEQQLQTSRADEADSWATGKKGSFGGGFERGGERQSRYGGGGISDDGFSRADGADSWTAGKKPIGGGFGGSSGGRFSTFGSGFQSSRPETDRWSRGSGGGLERPTLVLDPRKGDSGATTEVVKTNKPNPFGQARPREDVLAEKGLDWKKIDDEIEAKKTSRPNSAHSSRPSSAQSSRSEGQGVESVVKPRPKVNPFGEAKPREVLLAEKGVDWRKIDLELEHKRVGRPETEDEKMLKAEIDDLKKALEKEPKSSLESGLVPNTVQPNLQDIIQLKEQEFETLVRDLDNKVRFGAKVAERPGSGAGRGPVFSDRPPSRSSSFDEPQGADFGDRPQSRGKVDVWTRPGDERRGFQGGRERGFSRDFNRSTSRERW